MSFGKCKIYLPILRFEGPCGVSAASIAHVEITISIDHLSTNFSIWENASSYMEKELLIGHASHP